MSYSAGPRIPVGAAGIATLGPQSCVDTRLVSSAIVTWPTAYLAIYVPVRVGATVIIKKLGLANGSVASGNFDVGIYGSTGTRLVSSGSTAHSVTSNEQVVDITDTTLAPGLYYLAACVDNTTGRVKGLSIAAPIPAAQGVLVEDLGASVVLPATATWTMSQTLAYIPSLFAYLTTLVA